LPASNPDSSPLSYTIGAAQQSGVSLQVPKTDGPLIGYSLRTIDVSQEVKRTFTLNRTEAVTQHYHPSGPLSRDGIGASFDPAQQITKVALGEGPFKILVIKALAGFDFAAHFIVSATVHIEYPSAAGNPPVQQALDIELTKDKTAGQVQFFADDNGDQAFRYWVDFTYDPDRVVGGAGQAVRSAVFEGVLERSITVDLDRHSPLIPVEVLAGQLNFEEGVIKQVQVRVAPTAGTEGHTVLLGPTSSRDMVYVMPAGASRTYYLRQTFFFKDDSTSIEKTDCVDTQVVVNEPADLIFRMVPQFVDPWGLVKEVLVDATYTHSDGTAETATLHVTPDRPRSEFAVLLRPGDPRTWSAVARFVMKVGDPLTGPTQTFQAGEPFVGLTQAGFRVVAVELLEDPSIFGPSGLLGIKLTFCSDLNDPAQPRAEMLLKATRTGGAVVVPGLSAGASVQIAVDVIRHGVAPDHSVQILGPSETTLYLSL
jgi:hypothetical protein